MSRPHEDSNENVTITIPKDDYERLTNLLGWLRRMDGWCFINRKLGKFFFFGGIAVLIALSQGFDALRNIVGSVLGRSH